MANENGPPPQNGIENMTPTEAIMDQATIALKTAAYGHASILSYEDFRQALLEDRGLDVTEVARDAGFDHGPAYLRHLGLNVNENGNLVVPSFEEAAVSSKFIAAKRVEEQKRAEKRQHYKQNQNVQRRDPPQNGYRQQAAVGQLSRAINNADVAPPNELVDYQGDVDQLQPGRRVRIANGAVYTLPTITLHGFNDNQVQALQKKFDSKLRQKVKKIDELDKKIRNATGWNPENNN